MPTSKTICPEEELQPESEPGSETPTIPLVVMLTKEEARSHVTKINGNIGEIRTLLLDLQEREGWKALGYGNWRECAVAEFQQSQRHLYELLNAAKVERNICAIAQTSEPIPEGQLRPLTDLEPDQQRKVWKEAKETAPNGKVTGAHVQKVKEQVVKSWTRPQEDEKETPPDPDPERRPKPLTPEEQWNRGKAAGVDAFKSLLKNLKRYDPSSVMEGVSEFIGKKLKKDAHEMDPGNTERVLIGAIESVKLASAYIGQLTPDDPMFDRAIEILSEQIEHVKRRKKPRRLASL